jgi:hypothetical protein
LFCFVLGFNQSGVKDKSVFRFTPYDFCNAHCELRLAFRRIQWPVCPLRLFSIEILQKRLRSVPTVQREANLTAITVSDNQQIRIDPHIPPLPWPNRT